MKLWKRAASAIKDRKSLLAVGFSRRNADLEAAIIHATSHDDSSVDYTNSHIVYKFIRASPLNLKTLFHALSYRVNRTRSWIVALKSLMLFHGVLSCKIPTVLGEIRRLPFDLSSFSDGHSSIAKTWGFNVFVRAYFAFLSQYSSFLSDQVHRHRMNRRSGKSDTISQEFVRIEKLQSLLDLLLQSRPMADNMRTTLILEAMDCVVLESINIYGRICNSFVKIIPLVGKNDAATALKIIRKATSQREDLANFLELCKEFGVSNARDIPQFVKIPDEDVEAIEKIINGHEEEKPKKEEVVEENAMVVFDGSKLRTIITDKWEIFDDEYRDPLPIIVTNQPVYIEYSMPDLITF